MHIKDGTDQIMVKQKYDTCFSQFTISFLSLPAYVCFDSFTSISLD